MKSYVIQSGVTAYWNTSEPVMIGWDDVTHWTRFSRWGDARTFLTANLKDGRRLVVIQTDNPGDLKQLQKVSKAFRHKANLTVRFVRNDLTTNVTDALNALTPTDLGVYYKLADDVDKARAAAENRRAGSDPYLKIEFPPASDYPSDSLERLITAEFVARWDYERVHLAHYGNWNPTSAKLTRCTCMREDGVVKTPSGSCPEHKGNV